MLDTLNKHNPDYNRYIILCDEFDKRINYQELSCFKIIYWKEIIGELSSELVSKYDIVELNTSIKASAFKYLFNKVQNTEHIIYLDPDIQVFDELSAVEEAFLNQDILLTPHFLKPVPIDEKSPMENLALNYGLYNLGFIGLKGGSSIVLAFLDWWEERLLKKCFIDLNNGYFVDQLWVNMVTILFERVFILRNYGLNVAPWNLHEREIISYENGKYKMSDRGNLVFFHFSSFKFDENDLMSPYYNRITFENANLYQKKIYTDYAQNLIQYNAAFYSSILCAYFKHSAPQKVPAQWKKFLFSIIPPLILSMYYNSKMFLLRNIRIIKS
jgi:hypothetical protein